MRIGVVFWSPGEGIAREASHSFAELGHEVIEFPADSRLPAGLDLLFAYGPFGSMVPLGKQLLALPANIRPPFVFWQIEPLPNPDLPTWFIKAAGKLRSRADRFAFAQDENGLWRPAPGWVWLTTKGFRYRYCGDLLWLKRAGILTLLVIGSRPNGDLLRRLGLDSYQPPHPSYREGWGADLNLERDVPVLWLGKSATRRRRRLIERMRRELRQRGIEMLVVDGVENPYIFGDERTELLNRTRIVLNLLRNTWDSHAARFQLAAMNRALVVSEPCIDHTGFTPGKHFVMAPLEELADTIQYYLDHEAERQRIADRAHELIKRTPRQGIYALILAETFGPGVVPIADESSGTSDQEE